MTPLEFTRESDTHVAVFTSNTNNVLQIEREETNQKTAIRIYTRIDPSFEWKLVKNVIPMPAKFLCHLIMPKGMEVRVEVDGTVTNGGVI